MNSVVWLLMVTYIGESLAGILPVNPGGIGGLFRGPNSETIIRGPDGSEITSAQIGGHVQTESRLEPIIVPDYPDDQLAVSSVSVSPVETISISNDIEGASPSPFLVSPETSGIELHVSPVSTVSIPQTVPIESSGAVAIPTHVTTAEEPHIIETELVDAPEIEPNQNSDLKGPSGSITVRGSSSIISGPASTTISEPVRRIPIVTAPYAAPLPAVPSAVLIPPRINSVPQHFDLQSTLTLNTHLVPPPPPNDQIPLSPSTYPIQPPTYSSLNTELLPPPAPNTPVNLGGPSGASIADVSSFSPHTQYISSTPIPQESLPPHGIDLGQTIVSTTERSTVAPSSGDIDVSRINLGQVNTQQTIGVSSGQLQSASSTVSPINELNFVSSTPAPSFQTSVVSQPNGELTFSSETPLPPSVSPTTLSNGPDLIITSNGASGRTYAQDQSIITNRIITDTARPTPADNSEFLAPSRTPNIGIPSTPWLQVEPDHIIPKSSTVDGGHGAPISTILDTVLVQPTDPNNREVIEFNGKQLENVGNIVPVIHHPVLVTGGLTHIHNIPTASVSQLVSRNNFNPNDYNRYERRKRDKN